MLDAGGHNHIYFFLSKVCGVLMEMSDNCLLIGIGCNVLSAPSADVAARDGGRPPTSLSRHNSQMQAFLSNQSPSPPEEQLPSAGRKEEEVLFSVSGEDNDYIPEPTGDMTVSLAEGDYYKVLATEICSSIQRWVVSGDDTIEAVLADFQRNMVHSVQKIRDQQTATGAYVLPLRVNNDGTLQVMYKYHCWQQKIGLTIVIFRFYHNLGHCCR